MNALIVVGFMGSDAPVKALAVIGGAALGAMFIGWLVQVIVRLSFKQQVPRWPMWGLRVLGGGLAGFLVYLWLFGGGGAGIGGTGGWFGGGKGGGEQNAKDVARSKDGKDIDKSKEGKSKERVKDDQTAPGQSQTLRIEVLGDDPLKKIARADTFDASKRYRIEGGPTLYTLDEIRKLILQKRSDKSALRRVVLVVYLDSPARDRPQVSALADWARDLDPERGKVEVAFYEPDQNAPID
jgi:hypothetical protein